MHTSPGDSCNSSAWQATIPGIIINLRGALQFTSNTSVMCHQLEPKKLTTGAIYMIFVLLSFVALTLIGSSITVYEYFRKSSKKEEVSADVQKKISTNGDPCPEDEKKIAIWTQNCKQFLSCFSVQDNGKRLFRSASDAHHLNCIDGIRALGFSLTMVFHSVGLYVNILRNPEGSLISFRDSFAKGLFSIDVFFIISGLVTAYTVSYQYHENNGDISWLSFFIRRFFKLTPVPMIVMGFYTALFPYMGSGPLWPKYDTNPVCKENWIWNILYLSNFLSHQQQCYLTFWYLGCLMQLYIITPLFMIPLLRKPKMGYALAAFAIVLSYLVRSALTLQYGLEDIFMKLVTDVDNIVGNLSQIWPYFDIVYSKPYTRLGSYLVGIVLGCYIQKRKSTNFKKDSSVALSCGWKVPFLLLMFSSFIDTRSQSSTFEIVVAHSIKPLIFICFLAWNMFVCVSGGGGFLNKCLSCKFLTILSRLSYPAYITHSLVLEKYFLSIEELRDHSFLQMVLITSHLFLWILAVAFIVTLIFGMPVLNIYELIEKHFQNKWHQKTN